MVGSGYGLGLDCLFGAERRGLRSRWSAWEVLEGWVERLWNRVGDLDPEACLSSAASVG